MDDYKYPSFWETLWGDTWKPGYDSIGRYMVLLLAAIVVGVVLMFILDGRGDRKFIKSCYARGGHVHYKSSPGIGVVVGNVVVPTTNTTLIFAPGKEEDCQKCQAEEE